MCEVKQNLLFKDALKLKRPMAFHVMVKPAGPSCNLNCTYCYYLEKNKLFKEENSFMMSEELLGNFTKQFIEAQEIQVITFTWQGGEPTLAGLDFFKRAIYFQKKYSGGRKIENVFQTNGTRLNDDWCNFFSDNDILVGISIDGEEHNHDYYRKTQTGRPTFRVVIKGIELLLKHKVQFNTLSVVNDYNVHFASETYRFLKSIGSGFMQFLPVVERKTGNSENGVLTLSAPIHGDAVVTGWSVGGKEYGKFLITVFSEWVRNDVGRYFVQIFDAALASYVGSNPGLCVFNETCGDALIMEHNGNLYSCDHFVYPEYLLGNITESPLADLARSQRQFNFGIDKRNNLPGYCINCEVRYACHGECPKHRFIMTPDGDPGLNYLCESYRMFFKHVEPFMDFMAKELKNKRPPANVMSWIRNRENQVVRKAIPERNDPCPCGSGKKFKNCCGQKLQSSGL